MCITISTVSTLIIEYEDVLIKEIIRFLLSENVILSFKQKRDKRLARMSTDFKLHSSDNISGGSDVFYEGSKKNIISGKKMEESDSDSLSKSSKESDMKKPEAEKIKPFDVESSIEEELKDMEGGEEDEESHENGFKLVEFNKRLSSPEKNYNSPKRSVTENDDKKDDIQTKTLKEISMLLTRRKLEGYLSSSDSNIFPLTKHQKNKFLDSKDFIEICIRYCLMDDDGILNFINFLFVGDEDLFDMKCINLYPLKVYKLLLYYEKIAIFETLYEKEKECDKAEGSNIITESFSYCIIINNITVSLYLLKKYVKELYQRFLN